MSVHCPSCGSHHVITRNVGRKIGGATGAAAGTASGAAGALSGAKAGALVGKQSLYLDAATGRRIEISIRFTVPRLLRMRRSSPGA